MINFKICSFIKNNSLFFIVLSCLTVFCWLFFFTYLAVPFFKLLCQDTGPNGVYGVFLDFKKHNIFFQIFVDYIVLLKNNTSIDIVFTSIYNVYPSEALPHLEKIQCFCYDDQLVESKSTLYLPIYYKLSSNFYEDPLMSNVSDITVSYSIFKS